MQLGDVIGHATSTVKHPSLDGWKLTIVQLLDAQEQPEGEPVIAIDPLGAGRGDRVILTTDGKGTQQVIGSKATPARYFVMGLVD